MYMDFKKSVSCWPCWRQEIQYVLPVQILYHTWLSKPRLAVHSGTSIQKNVYITITFKKYSGNLTPGPSAPRVTSMPVDNTVKHWHWNMMPNMDGCTWCQSCVSCKLHDLFFIGARQGVKQTPILHWRGMHAHKKSSQIPRLTNLLSGYSAVGSAWVS